jgi:hypothetical protein
MQDDSANVATTPRSDKGNGQDIPPPNSESLTAKGIERFRAAGTNYVIQSKEVLTTVRIVKPGKELYIRVHPDPEMEFITYTLGTKDGHFPIDPDVFEAIREKVPDFHKHASCVSLRPYITNKGTISLWPLKRESPFSIGGNSYNLSAFNVADRGRVQWLRVTTDTDRGMWLGFDPEERLPEPTWPTDLTMEQLLIIALKGGVIDSVDHILIKPLRGIF